MGHKHLIAKAVERKAFSCSEVRELEKANRDPKLSILERNEIQSALTLIDKFDLDARAARWRAASEATLELLASVFTPIGWPFQGPEVEASEKREAELRKKLGISADLSGDVEEYLKYTLMEKEIKKACDEYDEQAGAELSETTKELFALSMPLFESVLTGAVKTAWDEYVAREKAKASESIASGAESSAKVDSEAVTQGETGNGWNEPASTPEKQVREIIQEVNDAPVEPEPIIKPPLEPAKVKQGKRLLKRIAALKVGDTVEYESTSGEGRGVVNDLTDQTVVLEVVGDPDVRVFHTSITKVTKL